jgi:hypothetical protein
MATHLAKLLLSRVGQLSDDDSPRIEAMIEDVRTAVARHGYSLGNYEHWGLPDEHYPISQCSRCKKLTFREDSTPDREVIDQFRLLLIPGRMSENQLICAECEEYARAR